ncbi:glycosyl transferase [Erwinia typographi]|uniref:Glycosyl transferase n=1 Tax=Erwinia typographi TaxID=371042 RepID=A0A0A3Z8X2_9GAMM|nr:glycosyltransferase [Erwinia typographi]KGT95492.1 glycosyl transferase [Erwinia typographi]
MIIDGLPGGGAEKVVLTLAKGLIERGHRVSLFSLRAVCDYTIPAGLDYHVVQDNCRKPWRKLTELSRRASQLDNEIMAEEKRGGAFDLIISHLHKTDRIVRRCPHLDPEKTWFCLHGVFSASYLANRQGFSLWLKKFKTRCVYQGRNIIGVSQYVVDDLKRSFKVRPSHERVIFNPFEFKAIEALSLAPCSLAGKDYLVHVGRFHQTKRHDRLLRAYAKSGVDAPLVLIGKGSSKATKAIKDLSVALGISHRVIFKGFISNPYPYIRSARLLIVSSDSEGFGNVLVEALLCQTPVVSTKCPGGPASILTGDLSRGLAEMDDDSLAAAIREVYQHPPEFSQHSLDVYSIDAICRQYLDLINVN